MLGYYRNSFQATVFISLYKYSLFLKTLAMMEGGIDITARKFNFYNLCLQSVKDL